MNGTTFKIMVVHTNLVGVTRMLIYDQHACGCVDATVDHIAHFIVFYLACRL